jgi:hypothetical protein
LVEGVDRRLKAVDIGTGAFQRRSQLDRLLLLPLGQLGGGLLV